MSCSVMANQQVKALAMLAGTSRLRRAAPYLERYAEKIMGLSLESRWLLLVIALGLSQIVVADNRDIIIRPSNAKDIECAKWYRDRHEKMLKAVESVGFEAGNIHEQCMEVTGAEKLCSCLLSNSQGAISFTTYATHAVMSNKQLETAVSMWPDGDSVYSHVLRLKSACASNGLAQ